LKRGEEYTSPTKHGMWIAPRLGVEWHTTGPVPAVRIAHRFETCRTGRYESGIVPALADVRRPVRPFRITVDNLVIRIERRPEEVPNTCRRIADATEGYPDVGIHRRPAFIVGVGAILAP